MGEGLEDTRIPGYLPEDTCIQNAAHGRKIGIFFGKTEIPPLDQSNTRIWDKTSKLDIWDPPSNPNPNPNPNPNSVQTGQLG